jgi:hypothetical protein
VGHGVEDAADAEGNDGAATGDGFDGDDAEVFDTGEEQSAGVAVEVCEVVVAGVADEFDLGVEIGGEGFEGFELRAFADDAEPQTRMGWSRGLYGTSAETTR